MHKYIYIYIYTHSFFSTNSISKDVIEDEWLCAKIKVSMFAYIINTYIHTYGIIIFEKYTSFIFETIPLRTGYNVCLIHWGRVTHVCVSKLTIIGSDDGLSPDRCQAIIWTNAGLLLIGPLGTNFSKILIEILIFSFKKTRLKMSSAKRRPFCLGLNVLIKIVRYFHFWISYCP